MLTTYSSSSLSLSGEKEVYGPSFSLRTLPPLKSPQFSPSTDLVFSVFNHWGCSSLLLGHTGLKDPSAMSVLASHKVGPSVTGDWGARLLHRLADGMLAQRPPA